MASAVGEAFVRVRPDTRGFRETAERDVGSAMKHVARRAVEAFAVVEGVKKGFDFLKDATKDAAATEKAMELVKRTFGGASEEVSRFAEHADKSFGLSTQQALGMAGQMGNLLKNMGLGTRQTSDMAVELTKRAADLASVFPKLSPEEALNKLRAGVAGQTRGLKQLGIVIDQSDVSAEALREHLIAPVRDSGKILAAQDRLTSAQAAAGAAIRKHGQSSLEAKLALDKVTIAQGALTAAEKGNLPHLTQNQQARARLNLLLDKTKQFSDAASRDDSLIQQQRRLSAEWTNAKEVIGQALLPIVTRLFGLLSRAVPAALALIKGAVNALRPYVVDLERVIEVVVTTIYSWRGEAERLGRFLSSHITIVEAVAGAVGGMAAAIGVYLAAMKAWEIATKIATAIQAAFNFVMSANPIGLVAIAIAGLVGALVVLYTHNARVRAIVQEVWAAVQLYVKTGIEVSQRVIHAFIQWAQRFWAQWGADIMRVVRVAWDTVRKLVNDALLVIHGYINVIMGLIHGDWDRVWKGLGQIVSGVLQGVLDYLSGMPRLFLAAARLLGRALWTGIKAGLGLLGELLLGVMKAGLRAGLDLGGWVIGEAKHLGAEMINGIIAGIKASPGAVKDALQSVVGDAVSGVGSALGISSPSRVTRDKLGKPMADGIVAGLKGLSADARATITGQIHDAMVQSQQALSGFAGDVGGSIGQVIDAGLARREAGLTRDPRAQRITAIQQQLDAEQRAADRAGRLASLSQAQQALTAATDPASIAQAQQQLADAQRAIRDSELQDEQAHLQKSLDNQKAQLEASAQARKDAASRGLSDLAAELNAGTITQAQFARRVATLIRRTAPDYKDAGKLLGTAFAQSFTNQLGALMAQAPLVGRGLRSFGGRGAGAAIALTDPVAIVNQAISDQRQQAAQAAAAARQSAASSGSMAGNVALGAAASGTGSYAAGALAAGGGRAGSAAADVVRTGLRMGLSHGEILTLIATGLQESGLSYGAVGDHGDSVGPFQYNVHGAGAGKSMAWRESIQEVIAEAARWHGVVGGAAAAAVQRPADRAGYAAAVDALISSGRAEAIFRQFAGAGTGAGTGSPGSPGTPRTAASIRAQAAIDAHHHDGGVTAARYVNIEHLNVTGPNPGETSRRVIAELDRSARGAPT